MSKETCANYKEAFDELFKKDGEFMTYLQKSITELMMEYFMKSVQSTQSNQTTQTDAQTYNMFFSVILNITKHEKYEIWKEHFKSILRHYSKIIELFNKNNYYERYISTNSLDEYVATLNSIAREINGADKGKDFNKEEIVKNIQFYVKLYKSIAVSFGEPYLKYIDATLDDSVKTIMRKLKIFLFPHYEKLNDVIKESNDEYIALIKNFNQYDFLKLYDTMAHVIILYDKEYPLELKPANQTSQTNQNNIAELISMVAMRMQMAKAKKMTESAKSTESESDKSEQSEQSEQTTKPLDV